MSQEQLKAEIQENQAQLEKLTSLFRDISQLFLDDPYLNAENAQQLRTLITEITCRASQLRELEREYAYLIYKSRESLSIQLGEDALAKSVMQVVSFGAIPQSEAETAITTSRKVYDLVRIHYLRNGGFEVGDSAIWNAIKRLAKLQGVEVNKFRSRDRSYTTLVGVWVSRKVADKLNQNT